ncbi:MAG: DUF1488 family protein [Candidatus Delongbacteria bacterium]|nr:DUF1488 family protein [Candidatus Delongbacteria bacterium]
MRFKDGLIAIGGNAPGHRIAFLAILDDDKKITCEITNEALIKIFKSEGSDESNKEAFEGNKEIIYSKAEEKILNGMYELFFEGKSILITSYDFEN